MSQNNVDNQILTAGLLIKTKFNCSKNWITNIIEFANSSTLRIPLVSEYFNENILTDNSIVIEFEDIRNQYIVNGSVTKIDIVGTQTMTIKIQSINQFKNRRKSARYYTSFGTNIASSDVQGITGITTNISLNGICFITSHPFDMATVVSMNILVGINNILTFKGKIVRIKLLEYGFEYAIELDENEQNNENVEFLVKNIQIQSNNLREALYKKFNIYLKQNSKSFFNLSILIIDSSDLLRYILKNELRNTGISEIFEASNGNEALDIISNSKPDIICISYIIYMLEGSQLFEKIGLKTSI
jgi:hypothetical protein